MSLAVIGALVRNDLRLYRTDRRALVVGILVPILIAAFFGYVFGGNGDPKDAGRIPVAVVDEDHSTVSRGIAADLAADPLLSVQMLGRAQAMALVRSGTVQAVAILPHDFGSNAARALFRNSGRPKVELLVDPSQASSGRIIEGLFAQYGMQEITREAFSGASGGAALSENLQGLENNTKLSAPVRSDLAALLQAAQSLNARNQQAGASGSGPQFTLRIPYEMTTTKVTSGTDVPYNGYAHSFAGMTVQFTLFTGIDAGVLLLLLRDRGIWQRLRSAPLHKSQFLLAKTLATTLISLFQFTIVYLVGIVMFKVRIDGSVAGLVALAVAFCLLNATFGLMLASLGRSAGATRGIAMMMVLLLVMIGGAWIPSFVFPRWLQRASLAAPTRWAVDGLDAVTWRGLGLHAALTPLLVVSATAVVCLAIAIWRFRWDD